MSAPHGQREGDEFRPCPFCESSRPFRETHGDIPGVIMHRIRCLDCGASTRWYDSASRAILAWNRRPAPTPSDPEGEVPTRGMVTQHEADQLRGRIASLEAELERVRGEPVGYAVRRDDSDTTQWALSPFGPYGGMSLRQARALAARHFKTTGHGQTIEVTVHALYPIPLSPESEEGP